MTLLQRLKNRLRLWLGIASPSKGALLLGEEIHARQIEALTGKTVERRSLTPLERLDLETTKKAAAEMPYIPPTALFHLHDDELEDEEPKR